jgi:pyruvate/2-oxoglutarate dehydrogenase complex dihydrolipoamide dehydrogenase (E3) component
VSTESGRRDYDVVIVGGGSGGYAAARTAASAGLRTAVVEGARELGGLCILRGCMPTKALLYAAEARHLARHGDLWGLRSGEAPFDWEAVIDRKDRLIREFADYRAEQLTSGSFTFIHATARFLDPHTLALSEGRTITADHFVLSTGSVVAPPPLPPLQAVGYLTSDDVLALRRLPRSLIVLGGGAVGVELAQLLARFDVKITLIQRSETLLKEFDEDAGEVLAGVFRREGIELFTQTQLVGATAAGGQKAITFLHQGRKEEARAEEILFALGRSPNTAGLGLDAAGVATKQGRVLTNERMQTNVPHIYAAGDCTSPYEIVHLAVLQGEIAAHNIAHPDRPRLVDYQLLLNVVFTDPQIAAVGLTERALRVQGIAYRAASYPFNDHGKSLIMEARDGFVKLLAAPATGEILGGCCVGPAAGELIHEIAVAMAGRMTARQFAAVPHYHPTLAEIWTYPAEELAAPAEHHIHPPPSPG